MSGWDKFTIVMNMTGAFGSFVFNGVWSARGWSRMRTTRAMISAYSALYVIAYAWLLIFQDQVAWSHVMRGVSMVAWPLVWIGPAWVGHRETQRLLRRFEAAATTVEDR